MKLVKNNKKIVGLFYNGVGYGDSGNPVIEHVFGASIPLKIYPSAGAEQTTGYTIGFTATTEQFKLYKSNDLTQPLDYLPKHKFVLKNIVDELRTEWILVYDGESLFHIEGGTNDVLAHVSTKVLPQEITLCLTDENDEIFLSNIPSVLKNVVSSSSTSVQYISSTLTSEQVRVEIVEKEEISLPHAIMAPSQVTKFFYLVSSKDSSNVVSVPLEKSVLL